MAIHIARAKVVHAVSSTLANLKRFTWLLEIRSTLATGRKMPAVEAMATPVGWVVDKSE
jgi:hypothetical protein